MKCRMRRNINLREWVKKVAKNQVVSLVFLWIQEAWEPPVNINTASVPLRRRVGHYQIIIDTNEITQRTYNARMYSKKGSNCK